MGLQQLCFIVCLVLAYGATFMCWWESQPSRASKLLAELICMHILFCQKIKLSRQTINKQTFMEAADLEKSFVLMGLFSAECLPALSVLIQERTADDCCCSYPATPCFTFRCRHYTHLHLGSAHSDHNPLLEGSMGIRWKSEKVLPLSSCYFFDQRVELTHRFQ